MLEFSLISSRSCPGRNRSSRPRFQQLAGVAHLGVIVAVDDVAPRDFVQIVVISRFSTRSARFRGGGVVVFKEERIDRSTISCVTRFTVVGRCCPCLKGFQMALKSSADRTAPAAVLL
jgi:hypothetical protein